MKPRFAQKMTKRLVIAAIAVPSVMLAAFTVSSNAQEKDKDKDKPALQKEAPKASGLYREFSGVIQLGNYDTKPQKKAPERYTLNIDGENGIESMADYYKAKDAPHVMGGTVYFAVFRNVGGGLGDSFGTGMPGGLDHHFVPGDGDSGAVGNARNRYSSPRLDTSAKYLFLFQVVGSRGLDSKNQMSDVQIDLVREAVKTVLHDDKEVNDKIKFAVGEEKVKLEKQQKEKQKDALNKLAKAVNKAMLPDDAVEDVHRFSMQLNVDPRHITSWGYFDNAAFAVHIAGQKEYIDRWGHPHKTVADGGVVPNNLIEDRIQVCSFLPGVTDLIKDVHFKTVKKKVYDMGITEGSFHVNDANIGIENSLQYRFIRGMKERGHSEIKFASHIPIQGKKPDFAIKPQMVRIITGDDRFGDLNPELMEDDDYTTSAFIVDFDRKGIQKRGSAEEVRGIPRTKHSVVFGFTTNLEPNRNRRLRLDDLESTERNNDLPFSEFFSDKVVAKVPARAEYSRGYEAWEKGKKLFGMARSNRQFAFVNKFDPLTGTDSRDPFSFVLQAGGGAGGGAAGAGAGAGASSLSVGGLGLTPPSAPAGSAGITGGGSGGVGGAPGGGISGGGAIPGFNNSFSRPGGGAGSGGGQGSGNGQGQPTEAQTQAGTQAGTQTINFNATLTNQQLQDQAQAQAQAQSQRQNQNQNQHNNNRHNNHGHHNNHHGHGGGHVVPAPASLLLGLLGLPGLYFLRRRKTEETPV